VAPQEALLTIYDPPSKNVGNSSSAGLDFMAEEDLREYAEDGTVARIEVDHCPVSITDS